MRFYGKDSEINLKTKNPEFVDWKWINVNEITNVDVNFMVEFFTAYTFSKSRKGMRGRVSNTAGVMVQIPVSNGYEWPYRIFWGTDVDITPQLKMVGEAFYAPFFLELHHRDRDDCEFIECFFCLQPFFK